MDAGAGVAGAALPCSSQVHRFCVQCKFNTLRAGDRRWMLVLEGQGQDYHGEAVNPKHLSTLEQLLGYGRAYAANAQQTNGLHHAVSATPDDDV